jgi:hypothetical protein
MHVIKIPSIGNEENKTRFSSSSIFSNSTIFSIFSISNIIEKIEEIENEKLRNYLKLEKLT